MTEQGEGGSLQRRRSSSATATAGGGGGGGKSYSSPKLQAARERLANPTDLQLDSSTGPRRSSLRQSHLQQHSSSNIHPLDRHRVLTIPVWARNEPPSPFTSPTVAPINTHHNLPSLTDLAPLEPPLLEEEDDHQQQQQQPQRTQQPPPSSSSKANLQRFSTRSSASSSHKPHRNNATSKRWLFSRKRISVPQHAAASSSTASVNLRPPSSHHHQQQSSSHTTHSRRPDSDSEDEDDPDAEGPERFWSFTLPPRYRNKIKDLNTFRMSSFKAAATGRAAHQAGGEGNEEEDEYEDVEEEQDQESGAAGTGTVVEGKTATDRSKSEPTANQSSSTTPNKPRKTPKRNNTDLSISVLSSSSAKTTTNITATRPVLSPASTSKRSSYVQGGATSAGAGKGKKTSQNEREKKGKKKSKDSTGTDHHHHHHHHHRPHLHRSRTSSAASSANNSSAGSSGSNNKSDEGGGEDQDDEYVRARRASGDGTGGVGLPRGAAAAELDQSPLMSWMRRKDSSRGPGGGAGAGGGGSRASTSPTSPRSPGPLGGFMFVPPNNQAGGGGKKGSQGSTGAGNGAAGAEDSGLPRVAEPERAHYAEPKQKQHELRLRGNGNGNGTQWTQEEEGREEEEQGAIKAMATANGAWDEGITSAMSKGGLGGGGAGLGMGSEFSRHQPRTPGWSTPWRPTTPTSSYPFGGFGSLWGGGGGGGRGSHDDHGGLDLEKLGGLLGRHSGTAGGRLHGGPMDRKGDKQARERSYMSRFRQFLLLNPFAPFAFRMINMSFTTATLAVAIRIHETLRSIGDSSLVGSSPILGIIFAPLTLAHVFTQIYMEYFGKPIGLWSVRSKLFYTLIELVFVCFWSAELSLAFDNLTTSPLECCCGASKLFRAEEAAEAINQNPERVGYVCRLQSTLAGLSFVSLLAYLIVLSVSLFRIFERLSRSQH